MRIYIIGNDGITLCREAPATMTEGEVAVASKEELHAAPLSGKRLLALWNALPGVEKRRKLGGRAALIDQLWAAIEALPDPDQTGLRSSDASTASDRSTPPRWFSGVAGSSSVARLLCDMLLSLPIARHRRGAGERTT